MVSVDWKGFLFNCDFNQAVSLPITDQNGHILKIDDLEIRWRINGTEDISCPTLLLLHCGGEGSSCTGATA